MHEFGEFVGRKGVSLAGMVSTGSGISQTGQAGWDLVVNSLQGDSENVDCECCGRMKDMKDCALVRVASAEDEPGCSVQECMIQRSCCKSGGLIGTDTTTPAGGRKGLPYCGDIGTEF